METNTDYIKQIDQIMAISPAFDGGDKYSKELAEWDPLNQSAAADVLESHGVVTARAKDLYRNNSHVSSAVNSIIDSVIGSGLKLSAKPAYRELGITVEQAAEWSKIVESKFKLFAYDINRQCDAAGRLTFGGMQRQAFRSLLVGSGSIATAEWIEKPGRKYKTALQMVDIDRLSTPDDKEETTKLRAGQEFNKNNEVTSYFIRTEHESDGINIFGSEGKWKKISKAHPWGRRKVIHVYDQERADQPIGISALAVVMQDCKMLQRFERAALEAAIFNAMLVASIESELGTNSVAGALGQEDGDPALKLLEGSSHFHGKKPLRINGITIPHMFPNEKLNIHRSEHPNDSFESFERSFLGHMAAGLNVSLEVLSRDYSQTNYSGARAGLMEMWMHFIPKRSFFGSEFCTQFYALWLEEAMDIGEVPTIPGAPSFNEAKTAWCWAEWIGPPKGQIDPLKEEKAEDLAIAGHRKTLQKSCAERGEDWEEVVEQIAIERKRIMELEESMGLSPPDEPTQTEEQAA